ncbi:MAG: DUF4386 domain-containing protein [Deinococcales bacterium]
MARGSVHNLPQNRLARVTGGFYLAFILASVLADLLGHIGIGTAEQTYRAITLHVASFRLGLVTVFVSTLLFLIAAWGLYVLLRSVNDSLALLFLLLNAIGVAIQGASLLALVSAMSLGGGANHLQALSAAQVEALVYHSINVHRTGFATAQLFFGTWLFPLGYLVYRSRVLPRLLGGLLMVDGIAVLIWFSQALLLPAHPEITYPGLVVSFVAEVGLALWLLVKGLDTVRPKTQSTGLIGDRPT